MGTKRKLGNTSEERQANFEEMVYLYNEKNYSLVDIAKKYGATKQAVSLFLIKRGFTPDKEKDIKRKQFRAKAKNTILEAKLEQMARERANQRIEKVIAQTKAKKYKNALKEIKDIINEFAKEDILTFPDFSKEQNYKLIQKQCSEPILKILKKINEVLNA